MHCLGMTFMPRRKMCSDSARKSDHECKVTNGGLAVESFPLLTVYLHNAPRIRELLARPIFSHFRTMHLVTVLAPLVVLLVQLL